MLNKMAGSFPYIWNQRNMFTITAIILFLSTCFGIADSLFDDSICSPTQNAISPLPSLSDVYSASIRWTSEEDKTVYDVRDDYDRRRSQAALTINMPRLPSASKIIYDLNLGYTSVIDDVSQRDCTVLQPTQSMHSYNDLPFLTSLSDLTKSISRARDLNYMGEITVHNVNTDHYSSCLYDYLTNTTMLYNLYFIGRLGRGDATWQLPHIPNGDKSLPYIISLHAKRGQDGKVQEFKVTGTVGRFEINPIFQDDTFLPPAGAWCEGLPMTSLPDLPASFSLLVEVVHLDTTKVSDQRIFFNAKRKLVRKDSKYIRDDLAAVDTGPFHSTIYDFNNGVKYNIDTNLMTCDPISEITENDDFAGSVTPKRLSPHEFKMEGSDVFFRTRDTRVQRIGQRTIRGVTTDVYIGQYPDETYHRNITIQWFFSKPQWQIYSGSSISSGALLRMEIYEVPDGNPSVYNVIKFNTAEPDYDVFDFSPCYTAKQKIHFLLLIEVQDPAAFSTISPRQVKDRIIEILGSLITEMNRFAALQVDYTKGSKDLYVYGTLLERVPVDNPNIQHTQPHTMEAAFSFLDGSVRSRLPFTITAPAGKNITLLPTRILRLDFSQEFTTPAPTSSTVERTPPIPQRKTTPSQTSTLTSTQTVPTPKQTASTSTQTAPTTTQTTPTSAQTIFTSAQAADEPPTKASGDCASLNNSSSQSLKGSDDSDKTNITVAALVGGMFGTLLLGLILGFIATRLYHVVRRLPDVRLVNPEDEQKF